MVPNETGRRMLAGSNIYQVTQGLASGGVTVILFSEGAQVMAEIIGPDGYDDIVQPMPLALTVAHSRCDEHTDILILDDEALWQPTWGLLRD